MFRSASATRCMKRSVKAVLDKGRSRSVTRVMGVRTLVVSNQSTQRFHVQNAHVLNGNGKIIRMLKPNSKTYPQFTSVRFYSLPPYTRIDLPALSPTMETGTIASWVVKEGDKFEPGDLLAEIETDKATVGFEAQDDGFIAKILVPEGAKDVSLGTPIAISVEEEGDVAAFKDFSIDQDSSSAPAEASPAPAAEPTPPSAPLPQASSTSYPRHEKILLPALSPTMTTGTIASWSVKEGDKVEEGDLLAEIETDKATMGMEAENEGYIAKILMPEGSKDIPLGTLLCIHVEEKGDVTAFADYVDQGDGAAAPQVQEPQQTSLGSSPGAQAPSTPALTPSPFTPAAKRPGDRLFVSPLARKIAIDKGVDLMQVEGSGPGGRIRQQDVLLYLEKAPQVSAPATPQAEAPATAPSTPAPSQPAPTTGEYVDIPLSNIRKITAKRLLESKQNLPHYYLTVDCNMGKLMEIRQQFNNDLKGDGIKLSVNDFIIKAASLACLKVPEVNSSWQDTFIRQFNTVDVSVAVSTDNGLITPIVFNAHAKGLSTIAQDVVGLAKKAREGKLQPNEFMGGTFTISNLGMFGIKQFTAIINPPQACILAIGTSRNECVPDETSENGISAVNLMSVTLSCDHRVVDGAVGARWLQHFKKYIENPTSMLL